MSTFRGHSNPHLGPLLFESEWTVASPLSPAVAVAAGAVADFHVSASLYSYRIPQGRVLEVKRCIGLAATDAAGLSFVQAQALLLTLDGGTIEYTAELPPGQYLANSAVGLGVGITLVDDWYAWNEEPDYFIAFAPTFQTFLLDVYMAGLFKNTNAAPRNVRFQFLAQIRQWVVKEAHQRPTIDWTMGQVVESVRGR